MNEYLIWALVAVNIYLFLSLRKEKKRLRVLTSFVGGLIKSASKVPAMIDEVVRKEVNARDVNGYEMVLKDISDSFEQDFWATPYEKFVKSDRDLFWENKLGNGGFNQMFLDFHDKCLKEWYAIQHNKDEGLMNDEALGEKLIYQDFLDNKAGNLKNVHISRNPRLFFKHLSEDEIKRMEVKRGTK